MRVPKALTASRRNARVVATSFLIRSSSASSTVGASGSVLYFVRARFTRGARDESAITVRCRSSRLSKVSNRWRVIVASMTVSEARGVQMS